MAEDTAERPLQGPGIERGEAPVQDHEIDPLKQPTGDVEAASLAMGQLPSGLADHLQEAARHPREELVAAELLADLYRLRDGDGARRPLAAHQQVEGESRSEDVIFRGTGARRRRGGASRRGRASVDRGRRAGRDRGSARAEPLLASRKPPSATASAPAMKVDSSAATARTIQPRGSRATTSASLRPSRSSDARARPMRPSSPTCQRAGSSCARRVRRISVGLARRWAGRVRCTRGSTLSSRRRSRSSTACPKGHERPRRGRRQPIVTSSRRRKRASGHSY